MTALDLEKLVAIDVHVHVEQDLHGNLSADDELLRAAAKYFKGEPHHPTVPEIAEQAREHADVLIPFGSVDPHTGKAAVARARRLVTELVQVVLRREAELLAGRLRQRPDEPLVPALPVP